MGLLGRLGPHLLRWFVGLLYLFTFALLAATGAVAIYATYYYFLIPAVALRIPLYFDFSEKSPTALLNFRAAGEEVELRTDDIYSVSIALDLPESAENQNLGMFMVTVDLISVDNEPLMHSRRPAIMRYYSYPIRLASTFLYALPYLAGISIEKQRLTIPLIRGFRPPAQVKAALFTLTTQKSDAYMQLYSAVALIDTDLRGFRYFAYHWFISTTVVSVASLQVFLFFTLVFLCWGQMVGHIRSIRLDSERHRHAEQQNRQQHVGEAVHALALPTALAVSDENNHNE